MTATPKGSQMKKLL